MKETYFHKSVNTNAQVEASRLRLSAMYLKTRLGLRFISAVGNIM